MGKQLYKKGLRKCYACKEILELTSDNFKRNKAQNRGFDYECKKCANIKNKRCPYYFDLTNKRQSNLNYRYGFYEKNAKYRNYEWKLKKDDFKKISEKPCYYCGKKEKISGIDRIDNKKGYILENCVPCCTTCNKMKLCQTKNEFIEKCKIITERFK